MTLGVTIAHLSLSHDSIMTDLRHVNYDNYDKLRYQCGLLQAWLIAGVVIAFLVGLTIGAVIF